MLDTSKWDEAILDVIRDVHLDPNNVRLAVGGAQIDADIMHDLFVNENVIGLVEGICKIGFLTHDIPVVLKHAEGYVMLEGNRRLAALKAIQNPMLVPAYQSRVNAFARLIPERSVLSRLRVMVAPSRSEAEQFVAAIHTSNLRRAWKPDRQVAFFQAQLSAGKKLNELLERYPTIDVRRFVFSAHIVNEFASVEYDDPKLASFFSTKKWESGFSTLERITDAKDFRTLTGIEVDAEGNFKKLISDVAFKKVATIILEGIRDSTYNTRTLNSVTSPLFRELIDKLKNAVMDGNEVQCIELDDTRPMHTISSSVTENNGRQVTPAGNGHYGIDQRSDSSWPSSTTTSTNLEPSHASESMVSTDIPAVVPQNRPEYSSRHLDLGNVAPPDNYPLALRLLITELSKINIYTFPNATFLMIRAVLEKSIKSFAEEKGIEISRTGRWIQLGDALGWLLSYVNSHGPAALSQVVKSLITDDLFGAYTSKKMSLDAINHNHHFSVEPRHVIGMWNQFNSIMEYLMDAEAK